MWLLLALASALVFGLAGFGMKVGQMRGAPSQMTLVGLYLTGTLGFLFNWWQAGSLFSWPLLFAGVVIGLGSAGGNFAFMRAIESGPASLTSTIINMNVMLVIFMSVIVYGETIGLSKGIGVALFVLSIIMIAYKPERDKLLKAENSSLWLTLVLISTFLFAVRNGGLKVTLEAGLDNTAILFYSYLLPLLYFLFKYRESFFAKSPRETGRDLSWGLLSGIGSFGGMQLYAYALSQGPASIVTPVFSLYGLVIVVLSVLIYKERLNWLQKAAVAITFLGLLLVRI